MTEAAYNLDRETKIDNNIDALDKKWEVKHIRGSSLYLVRPNPDRPDAVIPKGMQGKWTKPDLLQKQINLYLENSWNKADASALKAERTAQALKEETARLKAEAKATADAKPVVKTPTKVKNDKGSTNK